MNEFPWNDIRIFIPAPREVSKQRLKQLFRHYLPKGNIVLGISRETHVVGFEGQSHFAMLRRETAESIVTQIAQAKLPHRVYLMEHGQADTPDFFAKLDKHQRVLLVNGSWHYAFHNSPGFRVLKERGVAHKFVSPFVDEAEARAYEASHTLTLESPVAGALLDERGMLDIARRAAKQSFDYSFQVGVALGRRRGDRYEFIASAFNKVIPYQARVLHEGSIRERHQSPPHDTNHYDTIHAEMLLLTDALGRRTDLAGTTLFMNLLPCPNCARTLSQTMISEIVYEHDHSEGYAAQLLRSCQKTVRRIDVLK